MWASCAFKVVSHIFLGYLIRTLLGRLESALPVPNVGNPLESAAGTVRALALVLFAGNRLTSATAEIRTMLDVMRAMVSVTQLASCAGVQAISGSTGTMEGEVKGTLQRLLSRGATRHLRCPEEVAGAWAALDSATALVRRCPVDLFSVDFVLLGPKHPAPAVQMTVFYSRPRRLRGGGSEVLPSVVLRCEDPQRSGPRLLDATEDQH